MAKKETDLIIGIIDDLKQDLKNDIKNFKEDAEKKIDHTRIIIKDEIVLRFDALEKRLDKIERKTDVLESHSFRLNELEKEFGCLDNKLDIHIKEHIKNLPKFAVTKFQVIFLWSLFIIFLTGVISGIIGFLSKIFKGA